MEAKASSLQGPSDLHSEQPLLWRGCTRIPCGFVRPHVLVQDTTVYVGGGNAVSFEHSRTVLKYNTVSDSWSKLPLSPYYTFALVFINGHVTTVGGVAVLSALVTNKLGSFDENGTKKWCHLFPAMPTERCVLSAVTSRDYLVAVGGVGEDNTTYLDTVEILNLSTMQWSTAAAVPEKITFMSIALCPLTSRLYLLGGLSSEGAVKSVLSCTLSTLIDSSVASINDGGSVWKSITEPPVTRAGCTVINGKLVIASGLESRDRTAHNVYSFDPETKKWSNLGKLTAARSSCSIAVLGGTQIMLVGGYVDTKNWTKSLTRDVMATVNLDI